MSWRQVVIMNRDKTKCLASMPSLLAQESKGAICLNVWCQQFFFITPVSQITPDQDMALTERFISDEGDWGEKQWVESCYLSTTDLCEGVCFKENRHSNDSFTVFCVLWFTPVPSHWISHLSRFIFNTCKLTVSCWTRARFNRQGGKHLWVSEKTLQSEG